MTRVELPTHPFSLSPEQLYSQFKVDPSKGLSTQQVELHTSQFGKNGKQIPLSLSATLFFFIEHVVTFLTQKPRVN